MSEVEWNGTEWLTVCYDIVIGKVKKRQWNSRADT